MTKLYYANRETQVRDMVTQDHVLLMMEPATDDGFYRELTPGLTSSPDRMQTTSPRQQACGGGPSAAGKAVHGVAGFLVESAKRGVSAVVPDPRSRVRRGCVAY